MSSKTFERLDGSGRRDELGAHQPLLRHINRLKKHNRDVTPSTSGTGRNRAKLGIPNFAEPIQDSDES